MVDSDAGYYDDGDTHDYSGEDSAGRVLMRWVFGAISVLSLAALLASYTFSQASEREPAEALLGRAMVHISQIDELLSSTYYEDLLQVATVAEQEGEQVTLPQYPIAITLEPTQILDTTLEELREIVLKLSAAELYERGLEAFLQEDGRSPELERFSPGGTIELTLGNLTRDSHDSAETLIQVFAIAAAFSLTLFLLLGRGFSRVTLLGVAVLLASLAALAAVFLVRVVLRTFTSAEGDPFIDGLNEVVNEAVELPTHNFTTFAVLGVGLIVFGIALTLVSRRFEYSE